MAFDCLYLRGRDLRARPLATRRNVLEGVLDGQDLVLPVRRLAEDGLAGRARARLRGLKWRTRSRPTAPAAQRGGELPGHGSTGGVTCGDDPRARPSHEGKGRPEAAPSGS